MYDATRYLYCDLETYSSVPISYGAHAYAASGDAEVMLFSYAFGDDEPPACWDLTSGRVIPDELRLALLDTDVMTVWHNGGMFDRVVLLATGFLHVPPIERWHDTMVQALTHALPARLAQLGEALGLPQDSQKDKAGRSLIRLFCKPRPKNSKLRRATSYTHPEKWDEFISYALQDIVAMRECHKRMPMWNYKGAERRLWEFDQQINMRGFRIDTVLCEAALRAGDTEAAKHVAATSEATGGHVDSATQRDALLDYLYEAHGVLLDDMKASTVEAALENADLPQEVLELLQLRIASTKTSTAKYKKALNAVNSDGRIRGALQFAGAGRTMRWAGRTLQPHNFPRPVEYVKHNWSAAVAAIKNGAVTELEQPTEVLASTLRAMIVPSAKKKLVVSDLANIEGRVLAWLAGEHWKLAAFADYDAGVGDDLYKLAYARSFNTRANDVDSAGRQIGKVQELALGYQGGVGAFVTFSLAYGLDLDALAEAALPTLPADVLEEAAGMWNWSVKKHKTFDLSHGVFMVCDALKRLWRRAHPATVQFWCDIEKAVRYAIQSPGGDLSTQTVGNPLSDSRLRVRRDGSWLRIRLPSGRYLCYPSPAVSEDGQISYLGLNQYSRKWQRIKTYGGKLAENATQAVARDCLPQAMYRAEAAGYEVLLTSHDEIITEAPDDPAWSHAALSKIMSQPISWASGLPLAAAGFEGACYRK